MKNSRWFYGAVVMAAMLMALALSGQAMAASAPVQPITIQVMPVCGGVFYPCAVGDFDGNAVLGPPDMSFWLADYFDGPPNSPAYDLSGDGTMTPLDLSIWLCLFFNCP